MVVQSLLLLHQILTLFFFISHLRHKPPSSFSHTLYYTGYYWFKHSCAPSLLSLICPTIVVLFFPLLVYVNCLYFLFILLGGVLLVMPPLHEPGLPSTHLRGSTLLRSICNKYLHDCRSQPGSTLLAR